MHPPEFTRFFIHQIITNYEQTDFVCVGSGGAGADANNDKFFIVIIDLMVIWDYSHQKGTKVQQVKPKRLQETSETARQGCNSKTSLRKNCKIDVKMRLKSVFPLKKFGNPILKQYLCTTRTRQASPRCSNVRVVLFLYNEQQNSIPEALHQCARPCLSLAVKRLDGYRYSKG